ncbi:hypothetical protein VM98_24875 [Streptomyces rubellomurinus subsp. indigoferus]|nr:hypothetical protein VM98_24875 [Streptomyces rubellomurinus subsp. indigoferus]
MRSPAAARLSPRDLAILATVRRLGQVTSSQLLRLHFADGSPRSRGARMRRTMARLSQWGLVARVPQRWIGGHAGGSGGYLYLPPDSRSRVYQDHKLAVAELYVQLTETARTGVFELTDFEAEPACHRPVGAVRLKPDAWLRIERGGRGRQGFIELDRGTESTGQITAKLATYAAASRAWPEDGAFPWVVFVVACDLPAEGARQRRLIQRAIQHHPDHDLFAVCDIDEAVATLVGDVCAA